MKSKMFVCAVIFGVLAYGLGYLNGGKQLVVASSEAAQPKADGDELAKLGKARLEAAEKVYKACFKRELNRQDYDPVPHYLSVAWLNAELDLAKRQEERVAAYSVHLQRMNDWEKEWKRIGAQQGEHILLVIGLFQREAEYLLAKERTNKK
ncbi:MAG: hypothetical protein EXS16_10395 [Gemmataceae bacterium]|nr:hypothetical protein [Gemmataceae bacterium]